MQFKKSLLLLAALGGLMAACQPDSGNAPTSPTRETIVETVVVTELIEGEAVEVVVTATGATEYSPAPPESPEGPQDNYFQDYGLNPFFDPAVDPLSTFAIDIDTGSYTVARRYIEDGLIPPAEAVRPEEFVNYFDQGYAPPANNAFAVYTDGAPSPFSDDGTYILRFGVQGYEIPDWERKPVRLTLVIDVSGSMEQDKRLELVKDAVEILVGRLREGDRVAVVAYSTSAWIVLDPTDAGAANKIMAAVNSLRPTNSTNAEAGLTLGYAMATTMFDPAVTNRVILLSDGVANVGDTSPGGILDTVANYARDGTTLTTIGVGMGNFNDVLMEQLADRGDGGYAYVDTLDEAEKIFGEGLVGTLQTIAFDAKIQVVFNPQVVSGYRLIGYENREVADSDFRNDAVDAGEIGAGHSVTALYAVHFHPGVAGEVARLHLRWEDPDTREVVEIARAVQTGDLANRFDAAAPRFQLSVVVAEYAEVLKESPWATGVRFEDVAQHALRLSGLLGDEAVQEFALLVTMAALLR
jgi:Ca-activated chloride channel family protein